MYNTEKSHCKDSPSKLAMVQASSIGLCCCCLELPCPKNIRNEYSWMGQAEIYGDMIKECFGLTFPEELKSKEQICEVCITRLRNSLCFRRQVVRCHAILLKQLTTIISTDKIIKTEAVEEEQNKGDVEKTEQPIENINEYETKISLNDLQIEDAPAEACSDIDPESSSDDSESNKDYEKPTIKVKKRKMLQSDLIQDRRTVPRTGHIKPRENIGNLLKNTTILPFKSNKGYFNCFYCNKQFVAIEELRSHVTASHNDVTFKAIINNILRPHDRIKADVSNINCKICLTKCNSLQDAVQHLEKHDIKFNYENKMRKPTDCLLPYDLSNGKFTCVFCRAEFYFFKTLTKHMNEHSTNYVCDVCGKCFLLSERLKAHTEVHASNASVPCDLCGKVCATKGRLRSHKRHHHKKRSHVCGICDQAFPTFRLRMQHLEDMHNRTPLNLSCNICLKNFKTTSHLGCHMRTEHYKIPYVRKRKKKSEEKTSYQVVKY